MDGQQPPPNNNPYPKMNGNNNIPPNMTFPHPSPANNPMTNIPPNFDLNSLPPAEREMMVRRFQLQQQQQQQQQQQLQLQQQQQQFQRNRQQQFQEQNQNFQRMTLNAYSTPRPPLSSPAANPMYINPMTAFPANPQMIPAARPLTNQSNSHNSINPALLQSSAPMPQPAPYMGQINPQQFVNPMASVAHLKSDPVLFSSSSGNNNFVRPPLPQNNPMPAVSETQQPSLPPLSEQIMSSEGNFIEHLIKFLDHIKFANRTIPQIGNRPISLFRLFQVVNSAGGFLAVGETKKWPLIAQALQLPPQNFEVVSTVRATYYTFLYAYEQYFVQRKSIDRIELPNQQPRTPIPPPNNPQQRPLNVPHVQNAVPESTSVAVPQQNIKSIPDAELHLWKPFADLMKIPISPATDIETVLLYLNGPYRLLRMEALLATQRLFAQATPKELQSSGFSLDSLKALLEGLESIWKGSFEHLPRRRVSAKTMETFWAEVDKNKRAILSSGNSFDENVRHLSTCRQIVSALRTLAVMRGAEICQVIAENAFIRDELLPFCLRYCDDWEVYKDCLILTESLSTFLTGANDDERRLVLWSVDQCVLELKQVRNERLSGFAYKLTGSLSLSRLGHFDSLGLARQTVSSLITQCAQLWKLVPSHVFVHLSLVLNFLMSCDDKGGPSLGLLVAELEAFVGVFVLPTVCLLRSVRGLLECTRDAAVCGSGSWDEVGRVLETVVYSPSFSLTDGGFLEMCLQILSKCQSLEPESVTGLNWTGLWLLLQELRGFWGHSSCEEGVPVLGKNCYMPAVNSAAPYSPAKRSFRNQAQQNPTQLALLKPTTNISSVFSHPYMLLCRCLELFAGAFGSLEPGMKIEVFEVALEWNLDIPSKWGREVLGSERLVRSLNSILGELD